MRILSKPPMTICTIIEIERFRIDRRIQIAPPEKVKMRKQSLAIFAMLAAVMIGGNGCEWGNQDLFNEIVDGDSVHLCPRLGEGTISYIEYVAETNTNGEKIFNKCDAKKCNSESDCCDFSDKKAKVFYNAFIHNMCPNDADECITDDELIYCTANKIIEVNVKCSEDKDCDETYGITKGKCNNNECNAIECMNEYHLTISNGIGKCELNNNDNCDGTQCVLSEFAEVVQCIERKCVDMICKEGAHLETDENGLNKCIGDNVYHCKDKVCVDLPGWISGDCVDSKCRADVCANGYHVLNNLNDDQYYVACERDDEFNCGAHKFSCEQQLNKVGVEHYTCQNAQCEVGKCKDGFHWTGRNDGCEENSVDHCGSWNNDCKNITGWSSGSCTKDSNDLYECVIATCGSEYFMSDERKCIPNTNEHCGNAKTQCTAENPYCTKGNDGYYCASVCSQGLKQCKSGCFNVKIDKNNCGDCDNICVTGDNMISECGNGNCIYNCNDGYANCDCNDGSSNCDASNRNYKNGCETHLVNMDGCGKCSNGYANCDGKWENGCEIKLSDYNWKDCNICDDDSRKCNNSDVCINFKEYGLKNCNSCDNDHTECGTIDGVLNSIPLCLKKGEYINGRNKESLKDIDWSSYECSKACNAIGDKSNQYIEYKNNKQEKISEYDYSQYYGYYFFKNKNRHRATKCQPAQYCNQASYTQYYDGWVHDVYYYRCDD